MTNSIMRQNLNKLTIGIAFLAISLTAIIIPAVAISRSLKQSPTRFLLAQADNSTIAIEHAIHRRINQYRSRNGLAPLRVDDRLSQMARSHSEAMAIGRESFGHQGFERRRKAIQKIMGYSNMAENVAYSGGLKLPDSQAVETWLRSSSHRDNIEGYYDTTGIGVSLSPSGRYYFTQIFVRRN
jgi:uncharacterized protein YkwD